MKVAGSEYRRIDVSYKTFKAYIEETELSESLSNLLNLQIIKIGGKMLRARVHALQF